MQGSVYVQESSGIVSSLITSDLVHLVFTSTGSAISLQHDLEVLIIPTPRFQMADYLDVVSTIIFTVEVPIMLVITSYLHDPNCDTIRDAILNPMPRCYSTNATSRFSHVVVYHSLSRRTLPLTEHNTCHLLVSPPINHFLFEAF